MLVYVLNIRFAYHDEEETMDEDNTGKQVQRIRDKQK